MGLFGTFGISGSALTTMRTWMDAVSDNIANLNTVRPTNESAFQARTVIAQAIEPETPTGQGGVQVTGIELGNPEGRVVHDPSHPLADAAGNVRYPDIDLSDQMVQLILAQRGYQSNLTVIERVKDAYQSALQIGK